MCGIAGVIGLSATEAEPVLGEMLRLIAHRGPDDEGRYVEDGIAIGMRRLSIIDLAGGHQPIADETAERIVVLNGEIYNFVALTEALVADGHRFSTRSDTEVVVHLFESLGLGTFDRLRGMFAFALYDKPAGRLIVARDPFGIKPLYYLKASNRIVAFGSEIKSVLAYPDYEPAVNEAAVFNYLSFQYNPLEETFFRGVHKLPPGAYLSIDVNTGEFEQRRFAVRRFSEDGARDADTAQQQVIDSLQDSVEHHLNADVPVGAFLSGGIDSTLIATLMRRVRPDGELSTFTVGGREVNEFDHARSTAAELKASHTQIMIDAEEYFASLPAVSWHFDEPVADPSAVLLYFLAREAATKVKVVLSGEGADELFGGYRVYREPLALAPVQRLPRPVLGPIRALSRLPVEARGFNYLRRASMDVQQRYIGNAHVFRPGEVAQIWRGPSIERLSLAPLYEDAATCSDPTKMQHIDLHTWLPGNILAKADKMTMAHSLELRVPFLDTVVWQVAHNLSNDLKFADRTTKYLLRRAAAGLLSDDVVGRQKLGFPVPLRIWMRRDDRWAAVLRESEWMASLFDRATMDGLIDDHLCGRCDNTRKLFVLLMLAIWHEVFFVARTPPAALSEVASVGPT